jgi:hypothetical protein
VRWYLRYSLSLRDVEELLAERGLEADHTTIWRWVQRYGPELNSGCAGSSPFDHAAVAAAGGAPIYPRFCAAKRALAIVIEGVRVLHCLFRHIAQFG